MRINGLNGVNNAQTGGMNMMQANDSVSKNIQNQIANAQKQLQELSSNKEMSIEEKMKKRQEIQQQITDLNNQLRQHQIEQRKEQQEKAAKSVEWQEIVKKENNSTGSSQQCMNASMMHAIISADSAVAHSRVQGRVATQMEGRAGVLESEIKIEMARGNDVEKKKEELAEVEQNAVQAESAQMDTLADTNKKLEEAAKADQQTEKTEKTDKKDAVSNEKDEKNVVATGENKISETEATTEVIGEDVAEGVDVSVPETVTYTHVDVRL